MSKILIAMSGGVDSSVAAALLHRQGHDCIGATMQLFHNEDIGIRSKTCCALSDIEDARSVATRLGIPYFVFNFSPQFRTQVMDRFVAAYEQGITPNPCIDCNRYIKFEAFYQRAMLLGCNAVATGHYARIEQEKGRFLLKKAFDESKDQSYVLYSLTQEQLAHTLFPLGKLHKDDVRIIAETRGFYNADKPDSQDICFVPDGNYARFIEGYTGRCYPRGNFTNEEGSVLGQHKGIPHYTVGQRKGLGITAEKPLYVKSIDVVNNSIMLCEKEGLFSRDAYVTDCNWIGFDTPPREFRAKVKVRYRSPEQWASIYADDVKSIRIVFDEPQRAITPGQAAVLYAGDRVLGGGTITI